MANKEHIALLKQGFEVWNQWRKTHKSVVPDLRMADLSGADLSGADLSGADLSGADLSKMDLGVMFSEMYLSDTDLSGANLSEANLSGVALTETDLNKADLSKADLSKADLTKANLSWADLSKAFLMDADLSGADLTRAILRGANLSKANLFGDLSCGYTYGAYGRSVTELSGADLSGADLNGTCLSKAMLNKALFSKADLSKAILIKLDLSGAVYRAVQFTAYYPREAHANQRYSFLLYAHTEEALEKVADDVEKFTDELGNKVPPPKTAKQTTQIRLDTPITVVPECDQIDFDPPSLTKKWSGEWTRFGFDFKPTQAMSGDTLLIRVSVQVATVEVAHINCAVEVMEQEAGSTQHRTEAENLLAEAKLDSNTSGLYQTIFISYSRKDKEVVKVYKLVQEAVGNIAFKDTDSIRAGEDWRSALARAIDQADIFQLFWSDNSAGSPNVRDEWEYALKHKCPGNRCIGFIRPVCWNDPIKPSPPKELGHLNFKYVRLDNLVIS